MIKKSSVMTTTTAHSLYTQYLTVKELSGRLLGLVILVAVMVHLHLHIIITKQVQHILFLVLTLYHLKTSLIWEESSLNL